MDAVDIRERALQAVALVPVALLVAALTCPATDIEPPWDDPFADEDAAGDAATTDSPRDDARSDASSDSAAGDPGDESAGPVEPPVIVPIGCADGETEIGGCCAAIGPHSVAIRWNTDRAVPSSARCLAEPSIEIDASDDTEAAAHRVIVSPLPPSTAVRCTVAAEGADEDLAALEFETAPDAPWVVVTEVLPNPRGPEPVQEFVEIANLGEEPVPLANWRLEDEGDGGSALPEGATIGPGEVALLVPGGFDAGGAGDPAVDPGAIVVRLGGSLGTQGLRNTGESVYLIDADGEVVSRYGNPLGALADGESAVRSPPEAPESDPFAWVTCADEPTPGRL